MAPSLLVPAGPVASAGAAAGPPPCDLTPTVDPMAVPAASDVILRNSFRVMFISLERTSRSNAEARPSLRWPRASYGLASAKDAKESQYFLAAFAAFAFQCGVSDSEML